MHKTLLTVNGNWNNEVYIRKVNRDKTEGKPELIWRKTPYPDKWDHMYGFSHFSLQLNYFPKRL